MKMLIAGGGTGGHLYPGVALAEEVTTRQHGNEILFVDSLSMKDAAGILVHDSASRQNVIEELKKAGFADGINGIPLEKFVVNNPGGDRDQIANAMEGLKPGVLP